MLNKVIDIVFVAILIALAFMAGRHSAPDTEIIRTDTVRIERTDTMIVEKPTEITRYVFRTDTVRVITIDSVGAETPSTAIIPIERTIYRDSTENASYEAYLSGYRTALDSIVINCRQTETVIMKVERIKPSRIGMGVQLGVGFSPKGMAAPYIGVGIQYNIFQK